MTVQQFKPLDYQRVAAEAVVDCFEGQPRVEGLSYQIDPGRERSAQMALIGETGFRNAAVQLSEAQLLENVRRVQMREHLPPSDKLVSTRAAPINFDVEMETGTGKTYVYIDTMYRLYERYGWSKFIVVVPSVAIREGVFKTFADTEAHFQERYGHKVRRFIYDSGRPEPILAFSDSPGLHCMIINTQAFASEVNAEGKESKTLRMFREMDAFQSRRPIDLIAGNHPILILDEPQRLEGAKTQEALSRFRAPIALRFSATHKTRHNLVHRLDALDAYTRKLVKRINVRGVTVKGLTGVHGYLYMSDIRVSADKPPEARVDIETVLNAGKVKRTARWLKKGDDLHNLSGGLAAYEGHTVADIDAVSRTLSFTNGVVLEEGRVQGQADEAAVRRVQIRETIRAHFERERLLYRRGIKVLSLFFIDEVAKYRRYDDAGAVAGEYARIFEEEYAAAIDELPQLDPTDEAWFAYVKRDDPASVHDGYFSIDKAGRLTDPPVNARGDEKGEAKDVSSYDLILKNKGRLLSLDEPVRFIFSHSALREGWDNPNVFTICTLKQSDHEIGKRQEVGRGLRISVDDFGRRTDGPEVHDINVLTVVASESYEDFAKSLQAELTKALEGRPREASVAYFTGKTILTATGSRELIRDEANALHRWLIRSDFIDERDHITPAWHEAKATDALPPLPESLAADAEGVIALVDTVLDQSALSRMTGTAHGTVTPSLRRANLEKAAFQELWSRINQRAVYFTDFDTDRLVAAATRRLDQDLKVDRQVIIVSGAELKTDIGVEDVRAGKGFQEEKARFQHEQAAVVTNVRYDLVGELAGLTRLTRGTVGRILKGVRQDTFALFSKNPEMFLRGTAELIRREKIALAIETLRYEKTGEAYDVAIFDTDRRDLPVGAVLAAGKHVLDHVAVDSSKERAFAQRLEAADEVVVYAKLPKGFSIPTPGGGYNPDWAIAVETAETRSLYFVAETKGSALKEALRTDEKQRIDSAAAYFRDVADRVTFSQVADYDQLMQLITNG
ncbi:DEAD/DEAH box helicase family protein [Brevundimonas vitis]|uniref:DEAD/DEAH box helicase family protein n=1 Tax=Brevundimonas vitisensis TaxID=2800818 RepID=A0ABX7BP32_9CAUL|nr:DEAD/DEAH box helicase family protein [Brevundimonas vitisensis]QQQ19339.1 DEAD/DEAH box helicase family protein [Brevundimonas vitisensis]